MNVTDGMDASFYRENAIIEPAIKDEKIPRKAYRYLIDSRHRDKSVYPSPSKYRINLEEKITNVISVELVTADVPFTTYLISASEHTLHVTEDGGSTTVTVELPIGDYTQAELAVAAEAALNAQCLATYTVTWEARTDTFTISSNLIDKVTADVLSFTLLAGESGSCARVMGFGEMTYDTAGTGGVLHAPYRADMRKDPYIVMLLRGAKALNATNSGVDKTFAMIPRTRNGLNYVSPTDSGRNIKYYNPIQPDLRTFDIAFLDRHGQPVDFQNQDHVIELVFNTYNQEIRYNQIFTL
jgi:hypothetical protein